MINRDYEFHECPDCMINIHTGAIPAGTHLCPCGCELTAICPSEVPHHDDWPNWCQVHTADDWDEFVHDMSHDARRTG